MSEMQAISIYNSSNSGDNDSVPIFTTDTQGCAAAGMHTQAAEMPPEKPLPAFSDGDKPSKPSGSHSGPK